MSDRRVSNPPVSYRQAFLTGWSQTRLRRAFFAFGEECRAERSGRGRGFRRQRGPALSIGQIFLGRSGAFGASAFARGPAPRNAPRALRIYTSGDGVKRSIRSRREGRPRLKPGATKTTSLLTEASQRLATRRSPPNGGLASFNSPRLQPGAGRAIFDLLCRRGGVAGAAQAPAPAERPQAAERPKKRSDQCSDAHVDDNGEGYKS